MKYLAGFIVGMVVAAAVLYKPPQAFTNPTYATRPQDCLLAKMHWDGWERYDTYKGGIDNGGISSMITYRCSP